MKLLFSSILFVFTYSVMGQNQPKSQYPKRTYQIDTLLFTKDTSCLLVKEFWDDVKVKSYACSVDSTDEKFRYGFLFLKTGVVRRYSLKNESNVTYYPRPKKYQGSRDCHDATPVVLLRIK